MDIRELAKEHAREVCKNPETWTNYLDTAAKLYRYPFIDTFLIHAQRPEATACASMPEWNKIMNRWVNRGAKGIALLDDSGSRLKLRYVFDIKDTHPVKGAKPIHLWKMSLKKEKTLKDHLNKTYDLKVTDKDRMPTVLRELARTLTAENIRQAMYELDKNRSNSYLSTMEEVTLLKHFTKLIEESITYVLMKRCGYHPLEHMELDDFEMIRMFDDINVLPYLGDAIQTITEPVLMDIGKKVNEIEMQEYQKNKQIEGQLEFKIDGNDVIFEIQSDYEKSKESAYGKETEHRLYRERRIPLPESRDKRYIQEDKEQENERSNTLSKGKEESNLLGNDIDRERAARELVAATLMFPLLPNPKEQQNIISNTIPRTSFKKNLEEKRAEANIINAKRILKSRRKEECL